MAQRVLKIISENINTIIDIILQYFIFCGDIGFKTTFLCPSFSVSYCHLYSFPDSILAWIMFTVAVGSCETQSVGTVSSRRAKYIPKETETNGFLGLLLTNMPMLASVWCSIWKFSKQICFKIFNTITAQPCWACCECSNYHSCRPK